MALVQPERQEVLRQPTDSPIEVMGDVYFRKHPVPLGCTQLGSQSVAGIAVAGCAVAGLDRHIRE